MRAALFIDVASLWLNARQFGDSVGRQKARVDYARLLDHLSGKHEVISRQAYLIPRPNTAMEAFMRALQHIGYTVIMIEPPAESVAPSIVKDLEDGSDAWDVAIIAAAEGQYADVFRRLRASGKQIFIHSFAINCPIMYLAKEVDMYVPMREDMLLGDQDSAVWTS